MPGRKVTVDREAKDNRQFIKADCKHTKELVNDINAKNLFADKAYDSDEIIEMAQSKGMNVVIHPKKNRKILRYYDAEIYKNRHLVENVFLHLKRWRGVATRYANWQLFRLGALLYGLKYYGNTI